MVTKKYPMYLAGEWVESDSPLDVTNPFNGNIIGRTWLASAEQLEQSIAAAERAFEVTRRQPVFERVKILDALADKLQQHRDEIAALIAQEAGKPIRDAETETDRGVFTVQMASEEAKRIEGDVVPLDLLPSSKGRFGIVRRFPIGPIAGISPFNYPLNLALHKVAPAIATGNPIVLKPPSKDPLVMLFVARVLDEIGIEPGSLSVLPMSRDVGNAMVEDDRFKLLSFTGSPDIGWEMKRNAGMKKVVLELGGNAGVIVDEDSDLAFAAQRVRVGAFAYAGQVCISVQRVFVHEKVYEPFVEALVAETGRVKTGDPLDRETDLGPMIDDKAAARSQQWIEDAVAAGARVLTGGKAEGRFMQPTIIENAPRESFVCSREAFAPLVTVFKVPSFGKAVEAVNDSIYGLQAGVFTNNLERALYAFENIDAGGVILNDVPTYRIDHMPYGGVKSSGLSREGIRYAIEDMTEMRLLVINRLESQRVID
jgi:acyl-CoA reductase-like NAD-dependent aldehyde dehydrogenase